MAASGKWLVIAEKPSVAGDIAKALGGFEKKADFYESPDYYVTWAVGHLLELLSPEDIDVKYKRWLLQDLPIIPERFAYKPKDGQKERLDAIRGLAKKKDVVGFINACDAGREGELIFRELYDFCAESKPMKRLWLQSMTRDAILTEFKSLKPGEEFAALGNAARCRAESDWLIGMNGTRAITRRLRPKMQKGASWSVGRVQTPTLALVVKRETEILRHRPDPYWTIEGRFSTDTHEYSGQWYDPKFKKPLQDEEDSAVREKEDRIFSKEKLDAILADARRHAATATASETRKESREIAPQMFDLTTLQREANRRFGMSASRTLQAAQRLYERYKLLTYPRTDSKFLPEDYVDQCKDIIGRLQIQGGPIASAGKAIVSKGMLNKERIFNNKGISDHFAIIPTGEAPSTALEGDDGRVYDLVLRRFLAAFMPHAVWAKVERITKVGEQNFRTRVQDLQEPGWRGVYGLDTEEESKLPKLSNAAADGSHSVPVKTEALEDQAAATKPPPRLTEAKLLGLMENCGRQVDDETFAEALKDKGLGTPATRAEIIENLIIKEYMQRSGKALKATAKGIRLVDVLARIPVSGLASVELTGDLESQLKLMEKGGTSREAFMKNMFAFTTEIVEKARSFEYDAIYAQEAPLGKCPSCGKGRIVETFWAYKCDNGIENGATKSGKPAVDACEFIIWKEKNQRYIDRSLVADVLSHGTFGPVEFQTNSGAAYEAMVTVTPKGFFLLDENGKPIEQMSLSDAQVLHEEIVTTTTLNLPGKIIETDIAYLCEFGPQVLLPVGAAVEETKEPVAVEAEAAKGKGKSKTTKAAPKKGKEAAPKKPAKVKRLVARMPKVLCGHPVALQEFKQFILTGVMGPITDFKSKKGRPFAASLLLKSNGNFEFKFESRKKLLEGEAGAVEKPKKPARKATSKAKVVKKGAAADVSAG
jgi:DNA topoisomerase-3